MKRIATFFLLCLALASKAQDTSKWTNDKLALFGTKAEVVHEQNIRNQSDSHYLFRLIGFKQFYANGLSAFIQSDMDFTVLDTKASNVYLFEKNGVFIGNKPSKIKAVFALDNDGRIVSVKITALFGDLAKLFLTYWPQSADYAVVTQLKPGTAAVKHCYGDLISFKWVNGLPVIYVTKDPNISYPVPTLTASN